MHQRNLKNNIRLSFDIDTEVHRRLCACLPHGVRATFLRRVVEIAVEKVEAGGYLMIGAIMKGDFDPLFKKEK